MRRVRAEWDRERTSVRNKTPLVRGWAGTPAGPSTLLGATPTFPLHPLPSCCLRVGGSSMAQRGAECWWEPRPCSTGKETGWRGAETRVHAANPGRGWLWAPSWVLIPEATSSGGGGGLGATGSLLPAWAMWSGPLPAQSSGGGAAGWVGAGSALGQGRWRRWSEPTHFWSTKMPTMRVKEIRSAVTHMRQYSSGGCGQTARGQPPVTASPHQAPDGGQGRTRRPELWVLWVGEGRVCVCAQDKMPVWCS